MSIEQRLGRLEKQNLVLKAALLGGVVFASVAGMARPAAHEDTPEHLTVRSLRVVDKTGDVVLHLRPYELPNEAGAAGVIDLQHDGAVRTFIQATEDGGRLVQLSQGSAAGLSLHTSGESAGMTLEMGKAEGPTRRMVLQSDPSTSTLKLAGGDQMPVVITADSNGDGEVKLRQATAR